MGERGPQPWHEKLRETEPEVFAKMMAGVHSGESLKDLHERLELGGYISYSRFCRYVDSAIPQAADRATAARLVEKMLRGETDVNDTMRFVMTSAVAGTIADGVKSSTLAALIKEITRTQKLMLEWRKDQRDSELHTIKMRLAEAKVKINAAAKDGAGGKKVVDLETVTRLLMDADMGAELPAAG